MANAISKSELKVLNLIAKGLTIESIGQKLEITKYTVQTRRNMLRKTGLNNTQQLVGWAVK